MKKTFIISAICLISAQTALSQGNNYAQDYTKFEGLALTPPMGWNSWNKFACNIDENLIKDLWIKKEVGTTEKPLKISIGGHDVSAFRLEIKK
jgi:hypothetical protein